MNPYTTDELTLPHIDESSIPPLEPPPPGMIRYIDIHVYDQPAEEEEDPAAVEGALDASDHTSVPNEQETQQILPLRSQRFQKFFPLVLTLTSLALIATIMVVVVLPLLAPTATITIIPVSKQITTTTMIIITNGPTSAPGQLAGRALPAITMSQAKTLQTTGTAHQDARSGSGVVVFYNAAPYAQMIVAGTVLTGADGTEIVTDQDAMIPAGNLATNGQASVEAHATVPGPAGNIQAGDIYGQCCRVDVLASNTAFHGGQRARDYHTVAKQDITNAVSSLSTSLQRSARAALQTQVQPDETLVPSLSCTQAVVSEYPIGVEATEDHVTVNETCTGMTYLTQGYQRLITTILDQAAQKQLETGYVPVEQGQSMITQVTMKHGTQVLKVHLMGTYAYQFTSKRQAYLKALIAGKSKAQVTTEMLSIPGVQSVSVTTKNGDTLPIDTSHIQMNLVVMP